MTSRISSQYAFCRAVKTYGWIVCVFALMIVAGISERASAKYFPAQGDLPEVNLSEEGFSPSAECGKCHKDIYSTWKNSLHSMSISDPVFWTAYLKSFYRNSEKTKKSCLKCHAPIASFNQDFDLKENLTREGISCDYCHTVSKIDKDENGKFQYTHTFGLLSQGPLKGIKSPVHRVRYNSLYTKSLFCAGCHEYETENGIKLMETYSEWKEGPYPKQNKDCQTCHMRKIEGKRVRKGIVKDPGIEISTHDIAGGHSISMRQKSVELKISDVSRHKQRVTVQVEVTNRGAGHKIPTGLPSKKFILKVVVQQKGGDSPQIKHRVYQKVVATADGTPVETDDELMIGIGDRILSDNRIAPLETRSEEFTFFIPEGKPVNITATVYYSNTPEIIQETPIHTKIQEVKRVLKK